jgi:hypothetical protein
VWAACQSESTGARPGPDHLVKRSARQQRDTWANVGAFHVSAWVHTLTELWAWGQPRQAVRDRGASPWEDRERRPSHADRRNAPQRLGLGHGFSNGRTDWP